MRRANTLSLYELGRMYPTEQSVIDYLECRFVLRRNGRGKPTIREMG